MSFEHSRNVRYRNPPVVDALEKNCADFNSASSLHGCLAIAYVLLLRRAIPLPVLIPEPPLFIELPARAVIDGVLLLPITHEIIDRAAASRWLKPGAKLLADLAAQRLQEAKCASDLKTESSADAAAALNYAVKARAQALKRTGLATAAAEACVCQRQKIESADSAAVAAELSAAAAEEVARKKPTPTNTQKAAASTKLATEARSLHRTEIRALKPLEEKASAALKAQIEAISVAEKAESAAAVEATAAETAATLEIQAIAAAQKAAEDRGPSWTWFDDNGRHFQTASKAATPNCSVAYGALNDRQRYCFSQILTELLCGDL